MVRPEIVVVDKNKTLHKIIKNTDRSKQKNILLYGAGGLLVKRFLAEGYSEIRHLFPNIKFIATDIFENGFHILKSIDLPWIKNGYVNVNKFPTIITENKILLNKKLINIDGVYLAVPTNHHLPLTKRWVPHVPTAVEKPLVHTHELSEIKSLFKKHKDNFMAIDFIGDSDAFSFAIKEDLLREIGDVTKIEGRLIENWEVEKGREWLTSDKGKSGGGLGIDIVVHAAYMVFLSMHHLNNKSEINITHGVLARYTNNEGNLPPGDLETYMWLKGTIGNIEVILDGGKGMHDTYYGICFTGTKGTLEIFTGSEKYEPYIILKRNKTGEETVWHFPKGGVGYAGTLTDFFLKIYGSNKTVGTDFQNRFKAAHNSVDTVAKVYKLTENQTPVLHKIQKEVSVPHPIKLSVSPHAKPRVKS